MRKEEIKRENIELKNEESLIQNALVPINIKDKEFGRFIEIYKCANDEFLRRLVNVKNEINETYGYDIITNITSRIKTPQSIINKMKKKHYDINYKNLVQNIDDIAGIRIVCPFQSDIFAIKDIIEEMEDIKIIEEKDYIKNPKQSGYSAYHLIVEIPIIYNEKELYVKAEVQIRTMTMDLWATAEHKMRYKSKKKLSWIDSKRLSLYAKVINLLDKKVIKMYKKQKETVLY
ncbi:MAG: GTP pyrophosphokinase family protein [Clostridia bacterium]|nr:GTP pyrophosphokinase family protein [Clostridia bacterium]